MFCTFSIAVAAPAHQLCFANCELNDRYGNMDATLENGASCTPDPSGQHHVELADVLEIGKRASVDDRDVHEVNLLKSYTDPVVIENVMYV